MPNLYVSLRLLLLGLLAWEVLNENSVATSSAPKGVAAVENSAARAVVSAVERGADASRSRGDRIVAEARKHVGVREVGGNNRGPEVEAFIANAGFERDAAIPWCAAFVRYVFDKAGLAEIGPKGKGAAWSPAWLARPTWTQDKGGKTPEPGAVFGIWFRNLGRIAHVGIVEAWGVQVTTIEGNTNVAGARDSVTGDGVWRRIRPKYAIYAVQQY